MWCSSAHADKRDSRVLLLIAPDARSGLLSGNEPAQNAAADAAGDGEAGQNLHFEAAALIIGMTPRRGRRQPAG